MTHPRKITSLSQEGAALVIVLAFVVLLTGLVVAYLSRTTTDRQVAHSSFNQANADEIALSATDLVVADLRQEIANGSAETKIGQNSDIILYTPTSNANMLP